MQTLHKPQRFSSTKDPEFLKFFWNDHRLVELHPTEAKARDSWEGCPELHQKFGEFPVMWAYIQALKNGSIKHARRSAVSQSLPAAGT